MTKIDIPTFTSAAILAIFGKVIEFKQFNWIQFNSIEFNLNQCLDEGILWEKGNWACLPSAIQPGFQHLRSMALPRVEKESEQPEVYFAWRIGGRPQNRLSQYSCRALPTPTEQAVWLLPVSDRCKRRVCVWSLLKYALFVFLPHYAYFEF